jgi:hypothetical protein
MPDPPLTMVYDWIPDPDSMVWPQRGTGDSEPVRTIEDPGSITFVLHDGRELTWDTDQLVGVLCGCPGFVSEWRKARREAA